MKLSFEAASHHRIRVDASRKLDDEGNSLGSDRPAAAASFECV
ncbi:hypothetical protein SFOMI_3238 [Sphingobium fuliginis]|uniref:Uncharacterized protein n=1 Tax=Sphingobium fuliginis (strain ATCC 27551) TaxID=336203 RepID=A0A292ZGV1_SPHSA|nr:hypothetical protein SFOMI_3238 [Sphingobium fuliginis]